jgi:hypothetical protein
MSIISTFHGDTMAAVSKRGRGLLKTRGIQKYNYFRAGVQLKDKKLHPHKTGKNSSTK